MPKKKKEISIESISNSLPSVITQSEGTSLEVKNEALSLIKAACRKVGLTLEGTLQVIKDAQTAKKLVALKDGSVMEEADHEKRLKAAAMHLEVEGLLKVRGSGETVNNYFDVKTLVQQWREIE